MSALIIDPKRLSKPRDKFRTGFPDLNFQEGYHFVTSGEPVLLTDPTYLADVYNSTDANVSFLRQWGVFVMDFGGDLGGPVWWQYPYLLIGICLSDETSVPPDVEVLAEEVGTDSGSYIFLPITDDIPPALRTEINKVLAENNGVLLHLPAGKWTVYYEQLDTPICKPASWHRNIVVKLEQTPHAI